MVKLLILYFSGTGNTHWVAQYIHNHLMGQKIEIELGSIETVSPEKILEFDILIFGFPVYACDSPGIVQKFIERIPSVENKGFFLFCTKGLTAGNALRRNSKRLIKQGYIPLGFTSIIMPGSDGITFMKKNSRFVKKSKNMDFEHMKKADRFIKKIQDIVIKLNNGDSIQTFRHALPFNFFTLLFLIDPLLVLMYGWIENSLKKKLFADENCNQCKICVKICPSHNISLLDSKTTFSDKCILCMRCINQCPQEAIQIGKLTRGKFRWRGPKAGYKPLKFIKGKFNGKRSEYAIF
jgi:ferredoxin